jgi:hypothetical protein
VVRCFQRLATHGAPGLRCRSSFSSTWGNIFVCPRREVGGGAPLP